MIVLARARLEDDTEVVAVRIYELPDSYFQPLNEGNAPGVLGDYPGRLRAGWHMHEDTFYDLEKSYIIAGKSDYWKIFLPPTISTCVRGGATQELKARKAKHIAWVPAIYLPAINNELGEVSL